MKRESHIADRSHQVESPSHRHLPLVDLLVDTRAELMELAVASGLKVLHTMLEADRTAICGPRYQHQVVRAASRAGTVPSEVVLGGRKVQIRRPRVRADGEEVALATFRAFADDDPLNRRVVEQMLVGVATRHYARSLEPTAANVRTRSTSKSAVSRRFVAKTAAQLAAWQSGPLDALDLVALLIDGVQVAEHCIVVALGIDNTGRKHALGLWEGSTENTAVCQSLLANLQSRGLRTDRSVLVILDGSKALHKAVTADLRPRRPDPSLPGAEAPERAGASARGPAALGARDHDARLSPLRRGGGPTAPAGSGASGSRIDTRAPPRVSARASMRR